MFARPHQHLGALLRTGTPLGDFTVMSLAAAINVAVTNPLWVIVTRMQTSATMRAVPSAVAAGKGTLPITAPASGGVCWWGCAGVLPNLILVCNPAMRQAMYDWLMRAAHTHVCGDDGSCRVHERAPAYGGGAAALATLLASVATHPIKRYRSRLQASNAETSTSGVVSRGRGSNDCGEWFNGLSVTLVHTVSSNTLMYVFKEQFTLFAMRVMQTR